jgi:hypothetical protein
MSQYDLTFARHWGKEHVDVSVRYDGKRWRRGPTIVSREAVGELFGDEDESFVFGFEAALRHSGELMDARIEAMRTSIDRDTAKGIADLAHRLRVPDNLISVLSGLDPSTAADQAFEIPKPLKGIPNVQCFYGVFYGSVYFLLDKGQVVYVGQTVSLASRILAHRKDKKQFDRVCFIVVPVNELISRESEYIKRFNPPYNRTPWISEASA